MLLRSARSLPFLFVLFHAAAIHGFSQDPRLLQLVPPESQIVAGMRSPSGAGQLGSFLLVTRNNAADQSDFFALTGGDTSRVLHELMFIASAGPKGVLSEHALLVSGHFDREAIFRSADGGGARRESYRGVPVLAVPPFARERESFDELRWLAILDERIAVFESVAIVQQIVARQIANSPTEPWLLERLSRLARGDDTWCLLPEPRKGGPVASLLGKLDRRLETIAGEGGSIEYGIHFGKYVEITASSNARGKPSLGANAFGMESLAVSYFLSNSNGRKSDVSQPVVVKVPRRRYEGWLAEFEGIVAGPRLDQHR